MFKGVDITRSTFPPPVTMHNVIHHYFSYYPHHITVRI